MHLLATLLPVLAVVSAAHSSPHGRHRRSAHTVEKRVANANIARSNEAHAQVVRVIKKRQVRQRGQTCRPRNPDAVAHVAIASSEAAAPTSSSAISSYAAVESSTSSQAPASTSEAVASPPPPPPPPPPAPTPQPDQGGQYGTNDARCGWSNASPENPNGSEDWLNCGVNSGGWTPPFLSLQDVKAAPLTGDGIFAPCAQYIWAFQQYGGEFGIPPIMLASFAMQESTCNPSVTGGGGEAGMMQIAPPNCEAGNDCWEINYNIRRGAQLFRQKIDAAGGNVIQAIGAYNGWQPGMTVESATAARWTACRNQNNLDYLTQWLNGWVQGKNGYDLGSYFNLRDCH